MKPDPLPSRDFQSLASTGRQAGSAFVHVALGVLWRDAGRQREILLTKRPAGVHRAGDWELPGGKVEDSESPVDALKREVREELDVNVDNLSITWLCICEHEYDDRTVRLETFLVHLPSGTEPGARKRFEHQWLPVEAIDTVQFPPANAPITREIIRRLTPYPVDHGS